MNIRIGTSVSEERVSPRSAVLVAVLLLLLSPVWGAETSESASAPLSLESAVGLALREHPGLDVLTHRTQAAHAALHRSEAAFLPKIRLVGEYLEQESTLSSMGLGEAFPALPGKAPPSVLRTLQYRQRWEGTLPVWSGGRLKADRRAAGRNLALTRAHVRIAREDLAVAAVAAFVQVHRAEELLASAREHETSVEARLVAVRKRFDAGLLWKTDLLTVQVRVEEARERRLCAENSLDTARTAFRIALGQPAGWRQDPGALASFPLPLEDPAALEADVLAGNPELQALDAERGLAGARLQRARAEDLPQLDLRGAVGKTGKDWPPEQKEWTVSAQMTWTAFDGGEVRAAVREQRHRAAEVDARRRGQVERLLGRLSDLVLDLRNARARMVVAESGLALAEEEVRLATRQHEAGFITLSDLLDRLARRTQARVTLITARFDLYLQALALWRLLGRAQKTFLPAAGTLDRPSGRG